MILVIIAAAAIDVSHGVHYSIGYYLIFNQWILVISVRRQQAIRVEFTIAQTDAVKQALNKKDFKK
jgi:hypothetical protein